MATKSAVRTEHATAPFQGAPEPRRGLEQMRDELERAALKAP